MALCEARERAARMKGPRSDVRLGLIGCGAAARSYYLPALKKLPATTQNVYLVDRNVDQARALAAEVGTPHYTDDYRNILDRVHGVIIAVPHFLHYRIAMDCLGKKVHVLCEKPLAETAQEVRDLIAAASRQGVTVSVNNTRRMFPTFHYIKSLIEDGQLGQVSTITIREAERFSWESATSFYVDPQLSAKGIVLDLGAHVLDLICWWTGGRPEIVSYADDSFGGPESVALLRARAGNCEIDVTLNRLVDLDPRYTIMGEKGTVACNPYEWKSVWITSSSHRARTVRMKTNVRGYREFVGALVHNFLGVIAGEEVPLIPATAVLPSIALIEECYKRRTRLPMPWYEGLEVRISG